MKRMIARLKLKHAAVRSGKGPRRSIRLPRYDGKTVRIVDPDGLVFEGTCTYSSAEYCEAEYGRNEPALEIDDWLFFKSCIRTVSVIPEKDTYIWYGKTEHQMRLAPEPYAMIEQGKKTIELRLYDEKRRAIKTGDLIRFENTADGDAVRVRVGDLMVFDTFAELYQTLPLTECGYTEETIKTASPDDMLAYYPEEKQKQYRVVGIRISLFDRDI